MKKIVSDTLYEAQARMPAGQNWNLNSKSACDTLAETIVAKLKQSYKDIEKQIAHASCCEEQAEALRERIEFFED